MNQAARVAYFISQAIANLWIYFLFKTIYTGGCAACASALAVWSVYREVGE